jgi:beta-lactamase superfamily II metal-dependent hydrolase
MFDGLEIDVLSVGDADCIVVTQWTPFGPQRILIDGGTGDDAEQILDFFRRRNFANFWAVICSHHHNDHARGLIKLIQDRSLTYHNGWMHDIRKHLSPETLRRASAGNSSQADNVREVIETTKELTSAFTGRYLTPQEPFAGTTIAGYPSMVVLGPALPFYDKVLAEFTKQESPDFKPSLPFFAALSAAGTERANSQLYGLTSLFSQPTSTPLTTLSSLLGAAPAPSKYGSLVPALAGVLSNSNVKENPVTQPFNNTSTIIGASFGTSRFLFTADAGADALVRIPPEWKDLKWLQVPHHGSDGNLSKGLIERFRPQFANISAVGDTSHPSRAIVSGLVKVGARVFSTHLSGHLWFWMGNVPARADYSEAVPLKGTGAPIPVFGRSLVPGVLG